MQYKKPLIKFKGIEEVTCKNCGKKYLKAKKNRRKFKLHSGIRPKHSIACSTKCSRIITKIKNKERAKEYRVRPEVKKRMKEYRERSEVKEKAKEYNKKTYQKKKEKKNARM